MTIRTILVDDEKLAIQGLQLRLQAFPDVEVIGGNIATAAAALLAGPAFADKPEWAGGGKPERAGGPQERGNKHPDKRSEQERDRDGSREL